MAANGISSLPTKEERQLAKLELAKAKRQGKIITEGGGTWSASGSVDPTATAYRVRNEYDINQLPTKYVDNDTYDNPNIGGLVVGRPWFELPTPPGYVNWYGELNLMSPIGTYTEVIGGGITLDPGSYIDVGASLNSTTFTITMDANLYQGWDSNTWNAVWANEIWNSGIGPVAYWSSDTTLIFGIPSDNITFNTPSISLDERRLYTFVMNGVSVAVYINGSLIDSGTLTVTPTIPSINFIVGGRHNNDGSVGTTDARGGTYYSVKVEGIAKTASQVLADYTVWSS